MAFTNVVFAHGLLAGIILIIYKKYEVKKGCSGAFSNYETPLFSAGFFHYIINYFCGILLAEVFGVENKVVDT